MVSEASICTVINIHITHVILRFNNWRVATVLFIYTGTEKTVFGMRLDGLGFTGSLRGSSSEIVETTTLLPNLSANTLMRLRTICWHGSILFLLSAMSFSCNSVGDCRNILTTLLTLTINGSIRWLKIVLHKNPTEIILMSFFEQPGRKPATLLVICRFQFLCQLNLVRI